MTKLAICIPNYNRLKKLEGLITEIISQIKIYGLHDDVQIIVSDDCSEVDPTHMVETLISHNTDIDIRYKRFNENRGMDYNFVNSVMLSDAEFAWIIGNDDIPVNDGIYKAIILLNKYDQIDFLVTPFDTFTDDLSERLIEQLPFGNKYSTGKVFDTSNKSELNELLYSVKANFGLFGFLSNVIFRRSYWSQYVYDNLFSNKMHTIFIQVYMHLRTLLNGALYVYNPTKIIINRSGDEIATSDKRLYDVAIGLYDVIDFYFQGDVRDHLTRIIVDPYINGRTWNFPGTRKIQDLKTDKVELYKRLFVDEKDLDTLKKFDVYIYGAGKYGRKTESKLRDKKIEVKGFIDQNWETLRNIENIEVISIDELKRRLTSNTYVFIANAKDTVDIYKLLATNNVLNIGVLI